MGKTEATQLVTEIERTFGNDMTARVVRVKGTNTFQVWATEPYSGESREVGILDDADALYALHN